jgi:hypothetical protein
MALSWTYGGYCLPLASVSFRCTQASEQPDVVVLGLDVPYQRPGAGVGQSGQDVIRLDEPLGDRVVLDEISRLPVLCHRAHNACHAGNG